MNRRTKLSLLLSGAFCLALVAPLWKLSAPIRLRRQIEDQARVRLVGVKDRYGNHYREFHVYRAYYDERSDSYFFDYLITWQNRQNWSASGGCMLRKVQSHYEGECIIGEDQQLMISLYN